MRRISITCLTLVSAAVLMLPAAAGAAPAKKRAKASAPTITRVTPMRVRVGGVLTIRGRNFKAKRTKNTVIFRGPDGRSAFAKPRRASRKKLVVAVPSAVARLVAKGETGPKPDALQAARAGRQVQQVHLAAALAGDRVLRQRRRPGGGR